MMLSSSSTIKMLPTLFLGIILLNISISAHSAAHFSRDSDNPVLETHRVQYDQFFEPLKQLEQYFVRNHKVIFFTNKTMSSHDPLTFTFAWSDQNAVLRLSRYPNKPCSLHNFWKDNNGMLRGKEYLTIDGSKVINYPMGFYLAPNSSQRIYFFRQMLSTFEFSLNEHEDPGRMANNESQASCGTELLEQKLQELDKQTTRQTIDHVVIQVAIPIGVASILLVALCLILLFKYRWGIRLNFKNVTVESNEKQT